jgi:uncharacterized membrane protein (DUF106 family)
MVFEPILNPIFSPLLKLPVLWAIIIISFLISLIINVVYKLVTDQNLMKSLKEELKEHQKKIKEHKNNPEKMIELQKKAMQSNFQYMKHSMKPTLFTIIPIIIIFGWLNSHLAYEPITPGQTFTTTAFFNENVNGKVELITPEEIEIIDKPTKDITGMVTWELKAKEKGEFLLEYKFDKKSFTKDVLITDEKEYKEPETRIKDNELKAIKIDNKPVKPLNLFGWKLGWLGTYIIFSIIFSMILRKIMRVY